MSGVRRGTRGQYQCDDDYDNGQADHACTLLDARVLDAPITDVILRRCQFVDHAEAVLAQLEAEYDTVRDEAQHRQRERRRLQEEIDTLKQNLAMTRTPEHVTVIFEQIDRRTERLQAMVDTDLHGGGRMLSAAQVATVRAFLADLRTGWDQQPAGLRNEFMRLVLDRVVVHVDRGAVDATLLWRTGAEQHLWIERPLIRRGGKVPWAEADNHWLRQHYATASKEALQARFPHRTVMAVRKQAATLGLTRPQHGISKPKGARWSAAENALLRAHAAGTMSYTDLCAQLPCRTWDAIDAQRRVLGLTRHQQAIYYHVVTDAREMVAEEDSSRKM